MKIGGIRSQVARSAAGVLGRAPGCTSSIRNSDTASPSDILVFAIVGLGGSSEADLPAADATARSSIRRKVTSRHLIPRKLQR